MFEVLHDTDLPLPCSLFCEISRSSKLQPQFFLYMDFFGVRRDSIRSEAYARLAALAALSSLALADVSARLQTQLKEPRKASGVISLAEWEVLVAICNAVADPAVNLSVDLAHYETVVTKLRQYLIDLAHFKFSKAVYDQLPHGHVPWLVLSKHLTLALVNLSFAGEGDLLDEVVETFTLFLEKLFEYSQFLPQQYSTLMGFINALQLAPQFFTRSEISFKIFYLLESCIDNNDFMRGADSHDTKGLEMNGGASTANDAAFELPPIAFIQALASLMAAISSSIVGDQENSLMSYILNRISADKSIATTQLPEISSNGDATPNGAYVHSNATMESVLSVVDRQLAVSSSSFNLTHNQLDFLKCLAEMALKKLELLDRGESYIVYSTMSRLKLGYVAKSQLLSVMVCGVFTALFEVDAVKQFFQSSVRIYDVMLDPQLGVAVIQLGSILVFKDPAIGSSLTRAFTSLVANPKLTLTHCQGMSKSVGLASRVLSQDAVVTTIYALTNLLFVGNDGLQIQARSRRNTGLRIVSESESRSTSSANPNRLIRNNTLLRTRSNLSTSNNSTYDFNEADYQKVCLNAVTAISEIVAACGDESVSILAATLLSQKILKISASFAPSLLEGLVSCAPYLPRKEFLVQIRLLHKLSLDAYKSNNKQLLEIFNNARVKLAQRLEFESELYFVYLSEILSAIISRGDVQVLDHHRPHDEISAIGEQIALYLKPLAMLLPDVHKGQKPLKVQDNQILYLFRNIWFNMVVHGFSIKSSHTKTFAVELERIAYNTPPLASELSWNRTETSLELNTVLKRGSSNHNVKDHRSIVGEVLEVPRTLSHSKLMFLAATLYVESLRVKSGNCHTILEYFTDPSMKTSGIEKFLGLLAFKINQDFINLVHCGADKQFSAQNIAEQLTAMMTLCCSGLEDLQIAAFQCCNLLISNVPSSLCHHRSLFALFDLLSLLYDSVVDAEIKQYNPTFVFRAQKTGITLKLPDSNTWRYSTFSKFHGEAKQWVKLILLKCNFDSKSLIQAYVSELDRFQSNKTIQFGVSFALEMSGTIAATDRELVHLPRAARDSSVNLLPPMISQLTWRSNFISDLLDRVSLHTSEGRQKALADLRFQVATFKDMLNEGDTHFSIKDITDILSEIAGFALVQDKNLAELVRYLVEIPFKVFKSSSMRASASIWGAVMKERPNLSVLLISEITKCWESSIKLKQGVFSRAHDLSDPEFCKMEFLPSEYEHAAKVAAGVNKTFQPHQEIIKLLSSNFEATMNQSDHLLKIFTRFVTVGLRNIKNGSLHPFARMIRFELVRLAFDVLDYHSKLGSRSCKRLTELIFDSALSWFKARSHYPFGGNVLKVKADFTLLKEVGKILSMVNTYRNEQMEAKKALLTLFMDDEISKISVWLNSVDPVETTGSYTNDSISEKHVVMAYNIDPQLAINLAHRYTIRNLDIVLQKLISENPVPAIPYADAVQYFIGINAGQYMPLHLLLFWKPLSPVDAITLFLPPFNNNPYILQYAMRSLEHHDVNLTFFYVPQIVQSLRYDNKGYVQKIILETARVSQLFAHQIIWNMLANSYKDDEATQPDLLKPKLDKIQELMLAALSDENLDFYKKEFGFFSEVTSISGKLKPYIKKSKAEKKIKIDEEMAKIVMRPGVYLPSNPDGVLVEINRRSGKPLQSHAKAPFMATFKIKKEVEDVDEDGRVIKVPIEKWQSAIFKVGDDCRQDVLALQMISVFRTIWLNAGLDLYVFPNRVTATAPGCGVIDVLPNSTSRDMLGREAVNGLYEYYITKFGPETSIEFQKARNNLIRSLAGYSIISYLLQFKDRHNGNIMYDDQGHVLHIDFGFCFDIVPGGVKFEVAPFKLTREMVMVLGGSNNTQAFHWFQELCIKGYLACRPYMETIVRCVNPMLESGLPCFKEQTVKKLRKRFVPNKSEKEAALHFKGLISKAYESYYTTGYDEFQRLTNGIPY